MAIAGDVQIKVDSAALLEKAGLVRTNILNMEKCFDNLEQIVTRTSYYWIGEAGEMHRNIYREQMPKVDEMLKRLKEHPADLEGIARTYESAESQIQSYAEELPGNIIS